MKDRTKFTLIVAAVLLVVSFSGDQAQQVGTTPIQQISQEATVATGAIHSHTTAATLTITAAGSQCIYVDGYDVSDCATGTAVTAAAPTYITTTNLPGSPQIQVGSGVTAGLCQPTISPAWTRPLKNSVCGTNVTFVLPTFATNQVVSMNVYYHLVP